MLSLPEKLAPLASHHEQLRYMVHATKDAYVTPETLLADAYMVLRLIKTNHPDARGYGIAAREAVLALEPLLHKEQELRLLETAESAQELISHPAWVALREQAAKCLTAMGFDLQRWEALQRQ